MDNLLERVRVRYNEDEVIPSDAAINEALKTVHDRIAIRLQVMEVPELGASIIVDAAMKLLRRQGFEGMTSESVGDGGSISNSFVDDILKEYESEIQSLISMTRSAGVKFL